MPTMFDDVRGRVVDNLLVGQGRVITFLRRGLLDPFFRQDMRNECTIWCLKFQRKRICRFGGRSIRNILNGIFWPEIGKKWAKLGPKMGKIAEYG